MRGVVWTPKVLNLNIWIFQNYCHMKSKSNKILPVECVDLMDSSGKVMNLAAKQQSLALASSVLVDRQYYVLLRVCRESVCQKYVSLQNNHCQSHPELKGNKKITSGLTGQQTGSGSLRPPAGQSHSCHYKNLTKYT
uniref:Uncharacterized protein n=1 Tax=Amphilophus citrinellus TaxID=61819 RepID=A0A3Q0RRT8_AMPCI